MYSDHMSRTRSCVFDALAAASICWSWISFCRRIQFAVRCAAIRLTTAVKFGFIWTFFTIASNRFSVSASSSGGQLNDIGISNSTTVEKFMPGRFSVASIGREKTTVYFLSPR